MPEKDPYAAIAEPSTASDPYASIAEGETAAPAAPAAPPKPLTMGDYWTGASEFIGSLFRRLSPPGAHTSATNLREGLDTDAQKASAAAQQEQYNVAFGDKSVSSEIGGNVRSLAQETRAVLDKVASGLTDWRTAVGMIGSKLSPHVAAAYFLSLATKQTAEAATAPKEQRYTPDNIQNFLLGLSAMSGSAAHTGVAEIPGKVGDFAHRTGQRFTQSNAEVTTVSMVDKFTKDTAKAEAVQERVNRATASANQRAFEKGARDAVAKRTEHGQAVAEQRSDFQNKVTKQRDAHADKVAEVARQNQERVDLIQRKQGITQDIDQQSAALGREITTLEKAVNEEGDRRFKAVREKIGNPEADPQPLVDAVKNAEHTILQDIPENVKEFRRILSMEGDDAETLTADGVEFTPADPGFETLRKAYVESGILKEGEKLTWDKAQSLKSRLDARLRKASRTMNGDVKRAVRSVQESVLDEMGKMAEAKGAGDDWMQARSFWRQYKEDFHEPTGPSGSGSPVASALDAVDPKNIRQPFIRTQSTLGNRGIETLRKYAQYGGTGAIQQAETLMRSHQSLLDLEKPTARPKPEPKPPAPLEPPKPLKPPKPIEVQMRNAAQKPRPEPPTLESIREKKASAIHRKSSELGGLRRFDLMMLGGSAVAAFLAPFLDHWKAAAILTGPALFAIEKAVATGIDKPRVVEWLSRPRATDLAAIEKLPPEVKTHLRTEMQKFIKQNNVRPESVSEKVRNVLLMTPKPGGQQVKDLRAIQEKYGSNPAIPQGNNIE